VVVLAGVLIGRVVSGGTVGRSLPAPNPTNGTVSSDSPPPASASAGLHSSVATPTSGQAVTVSPSPLGVLTNWEDRVEEILSSTLAQTNKAAHLLELFPRLPVDGQVEVARHLSHLLPDRSYAGLGPYLTNSATPGPVVEVLLSGLLARPNQIKLPWLLEVASQQGNPASDQARSWLRSTLEEDNGTDWPKWRARTGEWLRDHPD
jgi:hypothetical protein